MLKISGKSISGMVTIGPLKIFRHQEFDIVQTTVDRPETEVARFDSARNTACAKMEQFYQEAVSHVGLDNSFIFKVYQHRLSRTLSRFTALARIPTCRLMFLT